MKKNNFLRFSILSLLAILFVLPQPSFAVSDKIYKQLATFSKIIDIVDKNYVDKVDEQKLIEGAINGMLSSLDPHSVYLPADVYKDFSVGTKGRFGGIGIEVAIKDGVLTVISPIQDSPADKAGIHSGDKILFIDGKSTKNASLNDAVHMMRGPIGKHVNLVIWQGGQSKSREISVEREVIKVESVKSEDLSTGLGYFRVSAFQEGTSKSLRRAIDKFKSDNNGEIQGLILDLRDNPGGLLTEAVKMVDLFIDKGVIVSTKGRDRVVEVKEAKKEGTLPGFPVVVLINGGSASASEIVAGALQDYGRAKLMGTTSFGKGSVQTVIDMDEGAALKITIAHYFTPKNRMIDGKGIDPDILLDKKGFEKKVGKSPKSQGESPKSQVPSPKSGEKDSDPQITKQEQFEEFQKQEAIQYLKRVS